MAELGREEGANTGRGAKAGAGPERLYPEQVADLLPSLGTLPNLGIWRKPSGGPAGWLLRRRHGQLEGRRRSRSRRSRRSRRRRRRSRSRSRRSRSRAAKPGLNFACRKLTVFVLIERGTI